jgi:hypothetical protein
LPYQFLEELEVHRLEKIQEQYEAYTKFKNIIDGQLCKITDNITNDVRISDLDSYQFLKKYKKSYFKRLQDIHKKIIQDLNVAKSKHPDWRKRDPIKEALMRCFNEGIGDPYSEDDERYKEFISTRTERYSKFVPPGYMDAEKNRTDPTKEKQYGDLKAWFQIMDYAKRYKNPVVIVTDDMKEDWWNKQNGKFFGPRVELMYEIYEHAGVHLGMYNTEGFLKYVKEELKITIENTLLEKVKQIEEEKRVSSTPISAGESELGAGNKVDLGTPQK